MREAIESFECFGGQCAVRISDPYSATANEAAKEARQVLLKAHGTLSRFDPESELSRLNRDPRREVEASDLLRRVVAAALAAGMRSGGLVDATLVDEIEAAGYADSREFEAAGARRPRGGVAHPAGPSSRAGWCEFEVDDAAGTVTRPPGIRLDPGGIAKGLMADLVGESLADFSTFAVDCCGDLRVGGRLGRERTILVDDPAGGAPLLKLRIIDGGVATSGITRRAWVGRDGRSAHQILDPASGMPAFTGIVQATAVAPTALLAETFAKSALLVGPEQAESRLPFGGVIVEEGGAVSVFEALTPLVAAGPAG